MRLQQGSGIFDELGLGIPRLGIGRDVQPIHEVGSWHEKTHYPT